MRFHALRATPFGLAAAAAPSAGHLGLRLLGPHALRFPALRAAPLVASAAGAPRLRPLPPSPRAAVWACRGGCAVRGPSWPPLARVPRHALSRASRDALSAC